MPVNTDGEAQASGLPWSVRALTRTRQADGVVYRREAAVEAQIEALVALGERERRRDLLRAATDELPWGDPRRLREETLVYFVREYARRGDDEAAWRIAEALIDRTAGHVQRKIARWRLSPDETDDCVRDLWALVYAALMNMGNSAEFWEVRFWVCLDRRLWNLIEKRQAVSDSEQSPGDAGVTGTAGEENATDRLFARLSDRGPSPEALSEHAEALRLLTETERTAVYLIFIEGLPEESDDPDRRSAAQVMGVTGRSIRNYLRRAKDKLRAYAAGEDGMPDGKRRK
jgi:DNA-directed RNA polymerase specialized sigma24 family protein